MLYDFEICHDRHGTNCFKYDYASVKFGYSDILPLSVADMDFMTAPKVIKAVEEIAHKGIYGYTYLDTAYYECVADWIRRSYRWQVLASHILFCPRIVQAVSVILETMSSEGDRVGIFTPSYSPLYEAIEKHKRLITEISLMYQEEYYRIDYERLEWEMKKGMKMFLLINPHNPTGRVWTRDELQRLTGLCCHYGVILISDEIHGDFVFGETQYTPAAAISAEAAQNCITLQSPAKTFNLPGIHVSHVITANEQWRLCLGDELEKRGLHEPNVFVVPAVKSALSEETALWKQDMLYYIQENIKFVSEFLQRELPFLTLAKHEGTYLLWISYRDSGMSADEIWDWLVNRCRIGIQMGENFKSGGEGFFRINVACPRKLLKTCLKRMAECCHN